MSALDELYHGCRRHGWRLGLTGHGEPLQLATLDIRARNGELLARVPVNGPRELDQAAVDAARALDRQGLIG